jgi:hypothetical protein
MQRKEALFLKFPAQLSGKEISKAGILVSIAGNSRPSALRQKRTLQYKRSRRLLAFPAESKSNPQKAV